MNRRSNGRSSSRGSRARAHVVVGMVLAFSILGPAGVLTERASPEAPAGEPAGSGSSLVDQELILGFGEADPIEGPDETDGGRTSVGLTPRTGPPVGDGGRGEPTAGAGPRFLGTYSVEGEQRAIFMVPGRKKPWTGRAGDRIEGTAFYLESFDGTRAKVVPVKD